MWKPELLAPAKNLERLKVAILYGANAVYLSGPQYGLRARADNFTLDQMRQAVNFAHNHQAKVYVTLNAFLHDADFEGLPEYCQFLQEINIDALIVSDFGVLRVVQKSCDIAIHLSTQASCINRYSAELWKTLGVQRIIVGRELTVAEAGNIQKHTGVDVEMFIHGAMCMAYSGHCTISNFTAGRDSNRGGCIQSCRVPYAIHLENKRTDAPYVSFMSSKDLWGIDNIADFFRAGICSLKIEGRMKSSFYVAQTTKTYRYLIDQYASELISESDYQTAITNLNAVPHREYFSGSLSRPADDDSVVSQLFGNNIGSYEYLGMVLDKHNSEIYLKLAKSLSVGDEIEFLPFNGKSIRYFVRELKTVKGTKIANMRQDSFVCLPINPEISALGKYTVVSITQASV